MITTSQLAVLDNSGLWPVFPILVTDDGSGLLVWDNHSSYYVWTDCDGEIAMGSSGSYFICQARYSYACPVHDAPL